jgi:hypothetical protein
MPHPNGTITTRYNQTTDGKWHIKIDLPQGIAGKFVWQGKEKKLKSGANVF